MIIVCELHLFMLYMEISNGCELHFISSTPNSNQVQCNLSEKPNMVIKLLYQLSLHCVMVEDQ